MEIRRSCDLPSSSQSRSARSLVRTRAGAARCAVAASSGEFVVVAGAGEDVDPGAVVVAVLGTASLDGSAGGTNRWAGSENGPSAVQDASGRGSAPEEPPVGGSGPTASFSADPVIRQPSSTVAPLSSRIGNRVPSEAWVAKKPFASGEESVLPPNSQDRLPCSCHARSHDRSSTSARSGGPSSRSKELARSNRRNRANVGARKSSLSVPRADLPLPRPHPAIESAASPRLPPEIPLSMNNDVRLGLLSLPAPQESTACFGDSPNRQPIAAAVQ